MQWNIYSGNKKKKKSVICRDVDGPKECQSEVVRKKKKILY